MKHKHNHTKLIVLSIVSIIVMIGVSFLAVKAFGGSEEQQRRDIQAAAEKVNDLYYDEAYVFLKEGISEQEVNDAKAAVVDLKTGKEEGQLEQRLNDINERFAALQATNQLFEALDDKQPLNGATLQEYVLVNGDTQEGSIQTIRDKYRDQLQAGDDGFYVTISLLLDEATEQYKTFTSIDGQLNKLRDNNELTYEDLTESLDRLRKELASEENPYVKARILEKIGKADKELVDAITDKRVQAARDAKRSAAEIAQIEAEGKSQRDASVERVKMDTEEQNKLRKTRHQVRPIPGGFSQSSHQSSASNAQPAKEKPSETPQPVEPSQSESEESSTSQPPAASGESQPPHIKEDDDSEKDEDEPSISHEWVPEINRPAPDNDHGSSGESSVVPDNREESIPDSQPHIVDDNH